MTRQRPGKEERHRLLTTLLDDDLDPALTLMSLYHERWEEEQTIDELKTHQRERPVLRSQTPGGVVQEVRCVDAGPLCGSRADAGGGREAADRPATSVFYRCTEDSALPFARVPHRAAQIRHWYQRLVQEVAEEILPPRRNRINPRVIKQKMSKWPKKRAHHRHPPQPDETLRGEHCAVPLTVWD